MKSWLRYTYKQIILGSFLLLSKNEMFPVYLLEINGFNNTLFNERSGTKGTMEVGNKP